MNILHRKLIKNVFINIATAILIVGCNGILPQGLPTSATFTKTLPSTPAFRTPTPTFTNTKPYTQTPTITLTPTPTATVFGGGRLGKIVFISDRTGNDEIYIMNSDGSEQTRLTHTLGHENHPVWSPDGSKIAFTSSSDQPGERAVFIMDPDGSHKKQLVGSIDSLSGFSWSPDGTKLVYVSVARDPIDADISVINLDGSGNKNLTRGFHRQEMMPSWSTDGTKIYYREFVTNDQYLINPNGTGLLKLDSEITPPVWAPDGLDFLFTKDHEIFLQNFATEQIVQLTNNKNYDFGPVWSPHGHEILFMSTRNQSVEQLFVMNRDGSNVRQISDFPDNKLSIYKWMWSPDQTKIVFEGHKGYVLRGVAYSIVNIFMLDIKTHELTNLSESESYSDDSPSFAP